MRTYKKVHTGPKSQGAGAQDGFLSEAYQEYVGVGSMGMVRSYRVSIREKSVFVKEGNSKKRVK